MKKIVFTLIASLILAACVQEDIEINQQYEEITFDPTFTAYVTRTNNSGIGFDTFYVWGYQTDSNDNTTCIFNNVPVSFIADKGIWEYDKNYKKEDDDMTGTRYWIPNCSYDFYAFAPEIDPMITISNTASNQPPQIDIMSWGMLPQNEYMYATYNSSETTSSDGSVVLAFNHILSKVSMSFTNDIHQHIKATVSNINLTIPQSGSVNINMDNITTSTAKSQIYTFKLKPENYDDPEILEVVELLPNNNNTGETSSILLFPNESNFDYEVRFDVTLAVHNDVPETYSNETVTPGTTTITGKLTKKLEIGKAYKFSTILTPEVIKSGTTDIYAEEIEGWNNANGEQQISIASKLGGTVTLTENLTLSDSFNVLDDLTIDLNGHTITYEGEGNGKEQLFNVQNGATLTINANDNEASAIIATKNAYIATAQNGSSVSITGGTFESQNSTDILKKEGTGIISVVRGSFLNWDPSNTSKQDNFVAQGSVSVLVNNYYVVDIPKPIIIQKPENDNPENPNYNVREEFIKALADPLVSKIVLHESIPADNYQGFTINHNIIIEGVGENIVINAGGSKDNNSPAAYAFNVFDINQNETYTVTFKNVTINGGGFAQIAYGSKAILQNCTINTCWNRTGRQVIVVVGGELEVINSHIYLDRTANYYMRISNNSNVVVDGSHFQVKNYLNQQLTDDVPNTAVNVSNSTLTIKAGTYYFDPSAWVNKTEYSLTQSGASWIVQPKE